MKKYLFAASAIVALGGSIAAEALAQANPNQLIAQRKGAMSLQAKYFGPILGMAHSLPIRRLPRR